LTAIKIIAIVMNNII